MKGPVRDWETVSSSMRIPREAPLFTAVGGKSLFAVSGKSQYHVVGTERGQSYDYSPEHDWDRCGEIYDLNDKTWQYLDPEIAFNTTQAPLVKGEDGEPTDFVLYSLCQETLMFFNFSSKTYTKKCDFFAERRPLPVRGGNKFTLMHAYLETAPVWHDNTLYWITCDMNLLGYSIDSQCWLTSPCLTCILPHSRSAPYFPWKVYPVLVALGHGKFLLIVAEEVAGRFTIASLVVTREEDCLAVSKLYFLNRFSFAGV